MNENLYFIREYDYEKLEYLRKNTTLNPIMSLKVLKKKLEAEYCQKQYKKYNISANIDNYLEKVNVYEYLCRMKLWQHKFINTYKIYGQKMSLAEYSVMALNKLINEDKLIRQRM